MLNDVRSKYIDLYRENHRLKDYIKSLETLLASKDPEWQEYLNLKEKFRGL